MIRRLPAKKKKSKYRNGYTRWHYVRPQFLKESRKSRNSEEPCSSVALPALFNKENHCCNYRLIEPKKTESDNAEVTQPTNARRTTCPRITFFQQMHWQEIKGEQKYIIN